MNFEYKTLENAFSKLPPNIQVVLTSPEVTENIKQIGEKNGLLMDQLSVLFDLTSYVLLGLLPSHDFVKTLSKEAGIDEPTAHAIAEDINNEVFRKIRTSMQEHGEVREEKKDVEEVGHDRWNYNKMPSAMYSKTLAPDVTAPNVDSNDIQGQSELVSAVPPKPPELVSSVLSTPPIQKPQERVSSISSQPSIPKTSEPVVDTYSHVNPIQTTEAKKLTHTFDVPQSPKPSHISALEKAGNFTIEHEPVHNHDHQGMVVIDGMGKRTLPTAGSATPRTSNEGIPPVNLPIAPANAVFNSPQIPVATIPKPAVFQAQEQIPKPAPIVPKPSIQIPSTPIPPRLPQTPAPLVPPGPPIPKPTVSQKPQVFQAQEQIPKPSPIEQPPIPKPHQIEQKPAISKLPPIVPKPQPTEKFTEPLPDQLLNKANSPIIQVKKETPPTLSPTIPTPIVETPKVIEEKKVVAPPVAPPPQTSPKSFDMYREPIV